MGDKDLYKGGARKETSYRRKVLISIRFYLRFHFQSGLLVVFSCLDVSQM